MARTTNRGKVTRRNGKQQIRRHPSKNQQKRKIGLVNEVRRSYKKFVFKLRSKHAEKKYKGDINFVYLLGGLGILFCLILVFIFTRKNATEVYLNENRIGIIKETKVTDTDLFNMAKAKVVTEKGTNIQTADKIILKPVHASKKEIVKVEYLTSQIAKSLHYQLQAFVIKVDGVEKSVLKNEAEANAVLKRVKEEYLPKGANEGDATFIEKVEVTGKYVGEDAIESADKAFTLLTQTVKTTKVYTVESKDTFWSMARSAGISIDELLKLNEGLTSTSIPRPGQKINLTESKPFLSVKTVETVTYVEPYPKPTQYQEDNTKSKSYKKVIQQGKDGQKEVTAQIIRVNGFETGEKKTVSEKTIVDPIPDVVLVGTN